MVRKVCILLLCALGTLLAREASAQQTRTLRFGLEWGFSERFLEGHHYNFLTEEGFRVDESGVSNDFHANAFILAKVGASIADMITVQLCSGFKGIGPGRRMIPVEGQVTVTPFGVESDGILGYLGAGIGIHDIKDTYVPVTANLGIGYRYRLERRCCLDLRMGPQICVDHPELFDAVSNQFVPEQRVRANDAVNIAITVSAGISF